MPTLNNVYVAGHSKDPRIRFEDLNEGILNFLVKVERDLRISRTRLPGTIRQTDWVGLEDLRIARLVQQGMEEARLTRISKMC